MNSAAISPLDNQNSEDRVPASMRCWRLGASPSTGAFAPAPPPSSPSATSTVVRWSSSWRAATTSAAAGLATAEALDALMW